jgi:hypothetical protein
VVTTPPGAKKRAPTPPGEACRRCGAALTGPYCAACGQAASGRLGFGRLAGEFFERVTELDFRYPRTAWALLRRPAWMIREYLDGNRATWFHPAKFVFLNATLYALIVAWRVPVEEIFAFRSADVTQGAVLFAIGAIAYLAFVYLLLAAATARWLFRGTFASVAEAYVALLYVYGQALLVLGIVGLVFWDTRLVRLFVLVYLVLVLVRLAGRPWWNALLRAVVVYVVYTVGALGTFYVLVALRTHLAG